MSDEIRAQAEAAEAFATLTPEEVEARLETCNVTVIGRFNPSIIEPNWVARQKVHASSDTFMVLISFGAGGDAPTFVAPDGLGWRVTDSRLVVFGPPASVAAFTAGVLKLLNHTPLAAVGVNFRHGRRDGNLDLGAPALDQMSVQGEMVEAGQSKVVRLDGDVRLGIRRVWTRHEQYTTYNFHLDSSDCERVVAHTSKIEDFQRMVEELEKA